MQGLACFFGFHRWKPLAARPLFANESDKRPIGLTQIRQCRCCGQFGKQTLEF